MPTRFLTPFEDIVLNLVFSVMNERRIERTIDEYMLIAARLRPLKVLWHLVNELLKSMHAKAIEAGVPLPLICRFQAGDERIVYEDYPRTVSYETVRTALVVSGMRLPGKRAKSF
ncbi:MAG TPA: hypothetical protein VGG11_06885 [Xanthobacteraceae bacterium]|jgi:hypothetical protein